MKKIMLSGLRNIVEGVASSSIQRYNCNYENESITLYGIDHKKLLTVCACGHGIHDSSSVPEDVISSWMYKFDDIAEKIFFATYNYDNSWDANSDERAEYLVENIQIDYGKLRRRVRDYINEIDIDDNNIILEIALRYNIKLS